MSTLISSSISWCKTVWWWYTLLSLLVPIQYSLKQCFTRSQWWWHKLMIGRSLMPVCCLGQNKFHYRWTPGKTNVVMHRILQDTFLINIIFTEFKNHISSNIWQHKATVNHQVSDVSSLSIFINHQEAELIIWYISLFPSPAYLHHRNNFSCASH